MTDPLIDSLPPLQRLALAYASVSTRPAWLALLALDGRLSAIVRGSREPMLGQIRLAWWRERLGEPAERWPKGEPVLVALASWQGAHGALVQLVDGWEALLGEAPLPASVLEEFSAGRAVGCRALAELFGVNAAPTLAAIEASARAWALADLAARVSHPTERETASALYRATPVPHARLPRALRPLTILHQMAARELAGNEQSVILRLLTSIRLGIFGH